MDQTLQAVIAATFSFIIVTAILAVIILVCQSNSKRSKRSSIQTNTRGIHNPPAPKPIGFDPVFESASFDPSLNRVSMQELLHATDNFSPDLIVGDGSFGLVYKARLYSGSVVAVKKLSPDAFQGLREFRAEMETLGRIRHPNIVKILGYCATGTDRVLIYEFVEKGNLDQWLYDTADEENYVEKSITRLPLSWKTRMKIVRGIARGLAHVHHGLDKPIIHRDIKASNILLDKNFEAHIADFGLARRIEGSHSHVSTQVAGTMGYLPPEYVQGATMATTMGDVYSFGVLVLEVVSGKRPSNPLMDDDEGGREVRLVEWISKMARKGRFLEILDASLARDGGVEMNVAVEVVKIGLKCAEERWKERPTMSDVVVELDRVMAVHGGEDSC